MPGKILCVRQRAAFYIRLIAGFFGEKSPCKTSPKSCLSCLSMFESAPYSIKRVNTWLAIR